jgi:hypothetical protein
MQAALYYTGILAMLGVTPSVRTPHRPWLRPRGPHVGALQPCTPGRRHGAIIKPLRRLDRRQSGMLRMALAERGQEALLEGMSWEPEPEFGPAFEATLRMLDWASLTAQVGGAGGLQRAPSKLLQAPFSLPTPGPSPIPRGILDQLSPTLAACIQVAAFAQTKMGQQACMAMLPARDQPACQALLRETRGVDALEAEYAADINFGGIQTAEVGMLEALVKRWVQTAGCKGVQHHQLHRPSCGVSASCGRLAGLRVECSAGLGLLALPSRPARFTAGHAAPESSPTPG